MVTSEINDLQLNENMVESLIFASVMFLFS